MRPLDSRGIPATAYAAGYERLREQAVSARPASGGDGLSVLARRGLAAWLHTRAERPVERVIVIDADLGRSGATADREGFQHLVAEVGMGRAGIVLGLEVS